MLQGESHVSRNNTRSLCNAHYYLLLADSSWALDLADIDDHWFSWDSWRPKGERHVRARSVKCRQVE